MFDHPLFKRLVGGFAIVLGVMSAVGTMMQGLGAQDIKSAWWRSGLIYGGIVGVGACTVLLIFAIRHDFRKTKAAKDAEPARVLREAATRLVGHLHERWFSSGRQFDAGYRVALFVPSLVDEHVVWRCVARTVTPPEKAAPWPQVDDIQQRTKAGLVNLAVTSSTNVDVPGVPADRRADVAVVSEYLRGSCLTEELHKQRSWPWATIRVRIARGRKSKILCAIVVEREDGMPIGLTSRSLDLREKRGPVQRQHDPCDWEHQLVAEIWAAVRDD